MATVDENRNVKDVIHIMKQKSIAAILLLAFALSSFAALPALAADDTAPVSAEKSSSLIKAKSDYHIDSYTLASSVINDEGTLYLPLRSTLAAMGAEVTTNPDNQARKLKLSSGAGEMQLYYNEEGTALATAAEGEYTKIKMVEGTTYVPMSFIQKLTNRVVSVQDTTLMLIKTDDTTVWKNLEAYSVDENYVVNNDIGEQIVATALKYLGVPYVWGGTSPSGFDCSGLVQYVYAENGISIGRTTYVQQAEATPVSFDELQPGDLVFWGSSAHHVGIYIGDGQYIHAPAPGQSVCIQSYSAYSFTSAGRIVD